MSIVMDVKNIKDAATDASRFLQTLFQPGDTILFRPIESWTENDKKKSLVDYKGTRYVLLGAKDQGGRWQPCPSRLAVALKQQNEQSEHTRANVFFGTCPRFGSAGKYDLAWQIRIVRTLWSDVDHCTPEEALERCKKAGLPEPSIVVASGNGAHLYWLLSEPYLIDDAGDPPPVETEFIDQGPGKKKKPRKYVKNADGSKTYIDSKCDAPPLSPKAQNIQDILSGIANKIGGDHTTDLSRILRVPDTLNRKDQRNGREPVPCRLDQLHPERRYGIEVFCELAKESPSCVERETIARVHLPAEKKLTPKRQDKFHELLTTCDLSEQGNRSEADFALCCWCVENGVKKDVVWAEVCNIGKFKEGGESYFSLTWGKAEQRTREKIYQRTRNGTTKRNGKTTGDGGDEERGVIDLLAEEICKPNHFARDAGGKLYRYKDGYFRPDGERFVKAQVKRILLAWDKAKLWSSRRASEVAEFIRVDTPELPSKPRADLVNTETGMVRVNDGVLLPHDPKYLSAVQLPVKYDPAATCPNIDKFVKTSFPADAHDLAWEIPGVLMTPMMWLQKAVLLLGEGSNGKSVWLSLLIRFMGKRNISSIALHQLESDKFATARLVGKLANICADLPSEHLAGTSTFKAIVGGDTLPAERKFQDSFDVEPFVRLVFSANHAPRSADSSAAFFRRWVVIPFDCTFEGDNQIPRDILDARLQAPEELSGLLNKALEGLRRVQYQRGLSESASVQAAWRDFHATTDPLAVWLDRHTIDDPGVFVPKKTIRVAYNAQIERTGRPSMTAKAFGQTIYKLRPNIEEKQRMYGGRLQWCYIGIGLAHQGEGNNSQDSRDPSISYRTETQTREGERDSSSKFIRENTVNSVNGVNGNGGCQHTNVVEEPTHDGYVNQTCRDCGEQLGCRKQEGN
ncbi:MAG: hypothetical protein JXM70_23650 [Pirellulales bacterium]|nr:hypothetical protein [Pirellulales bacterium]